LQILTIELVAEIIQPLEGNPVDAIHWAGLNGFLNPLGTVPVLPDRAGAAQARFNHKRIGRDMGAVPAADTNGLVHPNGLFS